MSVSNQKWFKIAASINEINFSAEGLAEAEADGKKLCIAKHDHHLFACSQKCPHAGGLLSEGYVDAAGNIVCPLHRYKYNLQNGRNISGEGYFLKTYPVEVRDDGVYVGISSTNLFGF
jgi:nitrite reductase/ring-hydroxylating ferredoxin subunit